MYQKLLTLCMLAVCTYTDIRYRRVYGWSLILYCILSIGGYISDEIISALGMSSVSIADMAVRLIADMAAGLIPGIICFVISWISRQSLGYGDSALIAVCGISLGLMNCLQLLFAAFFFAGIYGLVLIVIRRKSRKSDMPFVPFLFLGVVILLGGS